MAHSAHRKLVNFFGCEFYVHLRPAMPPGSGPSRPIPDAAIAITVSSSTLRIDRRFELDNVTPPHDARPIAHVMQRKLRR
jgi:hypothetical protein